MGGMRGFSAGSPGSAPGCAISPRSRRGSRGRSRAHVSSGLERNSCIAGKVVHPARRHHRTAYTMTLPQVTVVGAGQVGATVAHLLALKGLAHITLIDVVDGLAKGKALDMSQSAPVERFPGSVRGTTDYDAMAGARLVIITAGMSRKPGMSREDLLAANANIVGPIAERVARTTPDAVVIIVTNPLDLMVGLALQRTGFPRARVMGMAGVLDSARLRAFLAERLQASPADIQAMVLGSHGDLMVPLRSSITVKGKPVAGLLRAEELDRILQRTKDGGAEIVSLLKSGSAF